MTDPHGRRGIGLPRRTAPAAGAPIRHGWRATAEFLPALARPGQGRRPHERNACGGGSRDQRRHPASERRGAAGGHVSSRSRRSGCAGALRGAGGRQRLGGAARGPRRPLSGHAAGHGTDPRAGPGAQPRRRPRAGADHSLPRFRLHRRPGLAAGDPRGLRATRTAGSSAARSGSSPRTRAGRTSPRPSTSSTASARSGRSPATASPPPPTSRCAARCSRRSGPSPACRSPRTWNGACGRRPRASRPASLPDAVVRHPARSSMADLRRQWDRHISHHWSMQPKTRAGPRGMGAARGGDGGLAARRDPARSLRSDRLRGPARSGLTPAGRGADAALPGAADARRARRPGRAAAQRPLEPLMSPFRARNTRRPSCPLSLMMEYPHARAAERLRPDRARRAS